MAKVNCWTFKKCGREPGAAKVSEFGVCPAATESRVDGINGGKNGGRVCWMITGTLCGGKVEGHFASKLGNCLKCDLSQLVALEEGPRLASSKDVMARLK